jgi:hypothetical protein
MAKKQDNGWVVWLGLGLLAWLAYSGSQQEQSAGDTQHSALSTQDSGGGYLTNGNSTDATLDADGSNENAALLLPDSYEGEARMMLMPGAKPPAPPIGYRWLRVADVPPGDDGGVLYHLVDANGVEWSNSGYQFGNPVDGTSGGLKTNG